MSPTTPGTDELVARATKPAAEALRLHPFYRGKLQVHMDEWEVFPRVR